MCREARGGKYSDRFIDELIETLKHRNPYELSDAAQYIEEMLRLHKVAPGSQQFEDFSIDQLIYVIVRLADSIKKVPPGNYDSRWSTIVGLVKKKLGPHLNLGHALGRSK